MSTLELERRQTPGVVAHLQLLRSQFVSEPEAYRSTPAAIESDLVATLERRAASGSSRAPLQVSSSMAVGETQVTTASPHEIHAASEEGSDGVGGIEPVPNPQTSPFYAGVAALQSIVLSVGPVTEDWARAARLLRRAAIAFRARSPRAASTALLISDALTNTSPEGMTQGRLRPLRDGYRLLNGSFIRSEDEERLFESFLSEKWHTVAPYDAGFHVPGVE